MLNFTEAMDLTHKELAMAIVRDPITVSPEVTVREAIALMSGARSHGETSAIAQSASNPVQADARASCVVIVESQKVIGILTERDVVRLCANQQRLDEIPVSQVMTASVLTLRESAFTDLFAVINLLQQNHIRHLPIVNEQACLVGIVTHETLRQILQPTILLRLRLVREVMTQTVVTATLTDSLLAIAQRLVSHRISSVVVVDRDRPEDLPRPIGIVTERDLVQFQALELNFEGYHAAQVMSYPVIQVSASETLVTVQQLMERYLVHRVVVTGEVGELLGIVTQTNVLQALSPVELYRLTEVLEARVKQLEAEKLEALQSRNLALEEQIISRTAHLQKQLQRDQVIAHLATQIRSSLSLQTILETAVGQIHRIIGCDRVNIWKFEPDGSTVVVAESTHSSRSLMGERVQDECYQRHLMQVYREGHVRVVPDIYTTEMTDCHRELLIRLHTRAKMLLPLFCGTHLWGLLNVSESQTARDWQTDEIDLLRNLTNQLTIAIQQASINSQLQLELQERRQAETLLQIESDLLARVATQETLTDTLNHTCTVIETMLDGAMCSILLLDSKNHLRDGAAPNLPDHYRRQIDGVQAGEGVGSCGTAVHRRKQVIVADIANDPLWHDFKDLAVASGLRACWSTPIVAADQAILGTFGVYYHEVHSPSANEILLVDRFVHVVRLAIQRHQNEIALKQTNQRLQDAQRISHLGNWELDIQHNILYWSEEVFRIFEIDPQQFGVSYEAFLDLVHPDDRALVNEAYVNHLRDRQPYSLVHRLQLADGRIKYVCEQCETSFSADGTPLISQGTVQDITQQQEAEIQRERVEASMRQVIEGTAAFTGEVFFPALVRHISEALGVRYASVSQATPEGFQVLAFFADGALCPPTFLPYDLVPCCHQALQTGNCCYPADIQAIYPDNTLFTDLKVDSYLGVRLRNAAGDPIGNLCILHDAPLADPDWAKTLLSIFAARAGAELERLLAVQALEQLNLELESRVTQRTTELAEREALLQDFLNNANDLIQIVNIDTGHFEFVNQSWRDVLGYTPAEVDQLTIFDVLAPDCIPHCQQVMAQMQAGTLLDLKQVELMFVHKSGQPVLVEGSINCRYGVRADGRQQTLSTRAIFRDITARKATEQELQRREARYRGLMEGAADAILMADLQGNIVEANQSAELLLGYSLAELSTLHCTQLHPAEEHNKVTLHFAEIIQTQRAQLLGVNCRRQDGSTVLVDIMGSVINIDGEILVQGIFRDITDRIQIENALRESQQFLQAVLDTVPLAVFWKDLNSNYLGANRYFLRDAAFRSASELVGKNDFDMPWGDTEAEAYRADDRSVIDSGEAKLGIIEPQHQQDGVEIWLETNKLPLRNLAGEIVGVLCTYQDITDRRNAEIVLQRQLAAIEAAVNGIAILEDDCYLYLNSSHVELFGYQSTKELIGQSWRVLYSPEELERFDQEIWPALYERMFWQGEVMAMRKDGTTFPQQLSLTLSANNLLICVGEDISDRKAAETIIHQQANREMLLREITQRIRQSLDLPTIFDTACQEIRRLLQADRVGIFKFDPNTHWDDGEFVAESVVEGFVSAMAIRIHDHCFGDKYAPLYLQGRYAAMEDIFELEDQCHIDVLAQIQVRANLVMPLLCGEHLWGLLCIHQCSGTRQWQESEVALTQQLATQLAIAIQQASLYEQVQTELLERQQAEAKIALQLRRQQAIATITQLILQQSLDLEPILSTVVYQVKEVLHGDRVIIFRLYPDGTSRIVEERVSDGLPCLRDKHWDDEVWSPEILHCYWQGQPRIVPDVMDDRWTECLVEYSIEGHIQSKIVAPILQEIRPDENHRWVSPLANHKLWGVLVIHACTEKRVWLETEAQLLQQIANQVAIAIQQANLFEKLQEELTERQQAQSQLTERNQQLAETNTELARATRLKDEFLANMSHELRTPLNAILGMTEGLQEEVFGIVNEKQLNALNTVEKSASHLLTLINDILDVAKIESGNIELEPIPIAIEQLCFSSLAFVKQQALKKRIQLQTQIPLYLPELFVDEIRMRQVLLNLLTNAVKFTLEGGTVTLTVSLLPSNQNPSQPSYLRIAVTDTGIGIAPENITKLFKPFVQIDSALNRKYSGTGLGLALVKQIVELHGGQVGLTSELGVGSCFTIDLPYEGHMPQANPSTSVPDTTRSDLLSGDNLPTPSPLILLAEDNPANVATICGYLEAKGYRLLVANDGQEAIDLAVSYHPDIILMDVQMPGMDGLEAMRHIRQRECLLDTPIIALTALAMKGDQERCLAAGADRYLSKPVKLKQLDISIKALLSGCSLE